MNVGQLKKLIENIPDDAEVYAYADHGQTPEQVGNNLTITCEKDLKYYGDEFQWMDSEEYSDSIKVTAICVG